MDTSRLLLLDATSLATLQPTGVEVYAANLLPPLTRALQQAGWSVGWIGHGDAPASLPDGTHWYYSAHTRFWSQTALPALLRSLSPAVFYTPSGIPPFKAHCRTAFTVHDLGVYLEPQAYSFSQRLRLTVVAKQAAKQAACLIVPSQSVSKQIQQYWKRPERLITVAGEGYAPNVVIEEEVYVQRPFILFLGRIERKKNLLPLIAGFIKLADERQCQLVLAGGKGFGSKNVYLALKKVPATVRERILLPGYVSNGQKKWLYNHAVAGVLPCPIEGFGLPALECFASGLPVICAKAGALPEVGGSACLYAEPDSPTDWYLQMRHMLDDSSLRASLIKSGKQQLTLHSWEATATRVAKALAEAASLKP